MPPPDLIEKENEPLPQDVINRLMRDFFESKSKSTMEAYRNDLEAFSDWMDTEGIGQAIDMLIDGGAGRANMIALEYKNDLRHEKDLAPSTINRRLAALRSITKLARKFGFIHWSLTIENLSVEKYRDTRGPGPEGFKKMLQQARERNDAKGKRDLSIMRLLHDLALRRGEVVSLDMKDVNLAANTIQINGKGRNETITLTMPETTTEILEEWMDEREGSEGPLFTNFDRSNPEQKRLTGTAVYLITKEYGEKAGVERSHPHGLRHLSITQALNQTNGDLRAVQQFSRHQSVQNLRAYDDCRKNLQGKVAKKVAESKSSKIHG